jgi:hypothetical protein
MHGISPPQPHPYVEHMKRRITSEEWLAEVEAIIRSYRMGSAENRGDGALTRDEAVARLRRLGLTAGEAWRWLTATRGGSKF